MEKVAIGLVWQVYSVGIQAVINILFIVIMGRLVLPESFGQYALAAIFVSLLMSFTEFGFGVALVQIKDINDAHISLVFYASLFIGLIAYLFLLMFSKNIVHFYNNIFSVSYLSILGLNLIVKKLGVVSQSLLIRNMDFKKLAIINILSTFIGNIIVGFSLALIGFEVWSLVLAMLVTNIFITFGAILLRPHSLKFSYNKEAYNRILKYTKGYTLLQILTELANRMDLLIIGKFFNPSLLGFYERAQYVANLPRFYLGKTLDNLLFSIFSKYQNNNEKIKPFFYGLMTFINIIMLFFCLQLYFFPEEIITLLVGTQWLEMTHLVGIFSLFSFFKVFARFSYLLSRAKNKMYNASIVKAVYLVLVLIFTIKGVSLGINGIGSLIVLAALVEAILMLNISNRLINGTLKAMLLSLRIIGPLTILSIVKYEFLSYYIFSDLTIDYLFLLTSSFLDILIIYLLFRFIPKFFGEDFYHFVISLIKLLPKMYEKRKILK